MKRILSKPYKNPSNNWYTTTLFIERQYRTAPKLRTIEAVFTFDGHPDYIDARKTFVELGDPTGYKWAMEYLGSWAHFEELCRYDWFIKELESWRSQIHIVDLANAIETIRAIASTPQDKQALAAAKYLAEEGWKKGQGTRGRPSKLEVSGELKRAVALITAEDEDMQRIGLVK